MKILIPTLLLALISFCTEAQNLQTLPVANIQRNVRFKILAKDSINLDLNENYQLIEDSCSWIVRQGHFNNARRIFTGKFKDISKVDGTVVLSEGTYDNNGLKNGEFISYFFNGGLRSKGVYRNNRFEGRWEINYADAKPALIFTANNDTITIESAWDKNGKKIVDKGKGTYAVNQGTLTWKGKINNGRPDGLWDLYRTDDASERSLAIELYRKGVFLKGKNAIKEYTDATHVNLVGTDLLPFLNAENLTVGPPCYSVSRKHIVGAQYENGLSSFSVYISDVVNPVFSNYNISAFLGKLTLSGEVSEKGEIVNVRTTNSFNDDIAMKLGRALRNLPLLHPATVDGKPVKQSFEIVFSFVQGRYSFTYRFLPIKT